LRILLVPGYDMKTREKKLLKSFQLLNSAQQQTLQDIADFLLARSKGHNALNESPKQIVPEENESVIAALKRHVAMYPMLNRTKMLPETAELINQHVMHGRDKELIIDEIEQIFKRHYQAMCENSDEPT